MKLERIATEGEHGYPGVDVAGFSSGLTVLTGESSRELAAVGEMTVQLLLGAETFGRGSQPWLRGDVYLTAGGDAIRLSRRGVPDAPQVTAARKSGVTAAAVTPATWRAGVPAGVVSTIMFADGDADPARELLRLLSPEVAAAVRSLTPAAVESRQDDGALLRRRDELVARIETRLATQREKSEALAARLSELNEGRRRVAEEAEGVRSSLRTADAALDADETRRRYNELARIAEEAEGRRSADGWSPRVEDLDGQIARWRTTLAELERREAHVRDELAGVRPDDVAPELALADQRASIAVAQRLIADLESEVARFAKSGESPLCVCDDAHPRLNPLVETLAKHVGRLADLVGQQDRALRSQELLDEAEQITRSKEELRRQLEKLLGRRETLWRTTRARAGRVDEPRESGFDLGALEAERARLSERLAGLEAEVGRLDAEIAELSDQRRGLFESAELSAWREELAGIESGLAGAADRPRPASTLRASEVLANLTDGELTELRLVRGGRSCRAKTSAGRDLDEGEFTDEQLRLIVVALRVALADTLSAAGVETPLLMLDPFLRLSDRFAANVATALDDYRRRERQVVVFTTHAAALDRFRSLGVVVHSLRRAAPSPKPVTEVVEVPRVVRVEGSRFVLDIDDPIERFPAPIEDRGAAFGRARITTVRDLIAADPSAVADELAIADVSAELVSLWQAHTALVCFVPGLAFAEAKALTAARILTVADLAEADADELASELERGGVAWRSSRSLAEWIELAADEVDRWGSTGMADAWRRSGRERRDRIAENARRGGGGDAPRKKRRRTAEGAEKPKRRVRRRSVENELKFYLHPSDDVEAAPSIGPKMAQRLEALSIGTVAELLAADAESVSAGLDDSRVDAEAVVAWQHQAVLMCRVAGLRGHDSQILVACGFTNPEELASMQPADLLEFVDPYCDTDDAKRLLRGSSRPDLNEVASWIEGARRRRALEVA